MKAGRETKLSCAQISIEKSHRTEDSLRLLAKPFDLLAHRGYALISNNSVTPIFEYRITLY